MSSLFWLTAHLFLAGDITVDEAEFGPQLGLLHEPPCHSVAFVVIVETDHLGDQIAKKVLNIVVVLRKGGIRSYGKASPALNTNFYHPYEI
jgi:hypothetical protein